MRATWTCRTAVGVLIGALATLTGGCALWSPAKPATVDIACDVRSIPTEATLHYRLQSFPKGLKVPIVGPWVYLGRTPFTGTLPLSADTPGKPGASIAIKLSQPGYFPRIVHTSLEDLDLRAGIRVDAQLDPYNYLQEQKALEGVK